MKPGPFLAWNCDGQVGCDLPGHAPYQGSDTWRRERWQKITPKVRAIMKQADASYEPVCEVCKQAAERAAEQVEQQATGGGA